MIFFTADTHFGHEMIAKGRGFTGDHDSCLIDNINRKVKRHDSLVICGDFGLPQYRPQIDCKHIFFILGNHDVESKIRKVFGGYVWQQKMIKLSDGDMVFACHYPMVHWDGSHKGTYNAYGHTHYNINYEMAMDTMMPGRRSMDVGVDSAVHILGRYEPFSEFELLYYLRWASGHDKT